MHIQNYIYADPSMTVFFHVHEITSVYIAHYITKVVAEEERKEGNLNPMNYTRTIEHLHVGAQP